MTLTGPVPSRPVGTGAPIALSDIWYSIDSNPFMSTNCRRTLEPVAADINP
jgi:hypothetical protein